MQFQANGNDAGWTQRGDWVDVVQGDGRPGGSGVVMRARIDRQLARTMIHCHILPHEDDGLMGVMWASGTPGADDSFASQCPSVVTVPTASPTLAPTPPTASPSKAPTPPTTFAPSLAPTPPTRAPTSHSAAWRAEGQLLVLLLGAAAAFSQR
jgi:cell division septation protein DedD